MNRLFFNKVRRVLQRKCEALLGVLFFDLDKTLEAMALRPFELHLEFTNLCNADCVFCPYQFQERPHEFMSDEVFHKAIGDFTAIGGGSVSLTPIVGDALIHPQFLERVRHLRSQPAIDRIFVTTNGILLDKFGIGEVLTSGITSINISTPGFDRDSYLRIYRSNSYERMRNNVTRLVEENARLGSPVQVCIGLRTDRPLDVVVRDPDFQPILRHAPELDYTWSYTSAGGRITADMLPRGMKLRTSPAKKEACVVLYNGPVVLPDGTVLGCTCVAAVDALEDLKIGHILRESLLEIYTGELLKELRKQFAPGGCLNKTCAKCEMYRNLELYRTPEGRTRAQLNRQRHLGQTVRRQDNPHGIFPGG